MSYGNDALMPDQTYSSAPMDPDVDRIGFIHPESFNQANTENHGSTHSLTLAHSFTHSHTCSVSHSLSFSHTHSHTRSITFIISHPLSLIHLQTLTLAHSLFLTLSHVLILTLSHSVKLFFTPSFTYVLITHAHSFTLTFSLTYTLKHSETHSLLFIHLITLGFSSMKVLPLFFSYKKLFKTVFLLHFSKVEPVDARPNPDRGLPTRPGEFWLSHLMVPTCR